MRKPLLTATAFIAVLFLFNSCAKSKKVIVTHPVVVQGLFSLTGNWSSLGVTSKAAMELAQEDINKYLGDKDAKFSIAIAVSDTKLDPALTSPQFEAAKNMDIHFMIGPQSSAEVAGIKPQVDASKVILISQSSTAGSLAIDDNIFRFCPPDKIEGAATGNTIFKQGIKGLITVSRDDAGNKGLQTSVGAAYVAKGGEVSAITPYAASGANYASVVSSIKSEVARLTTKYGTGNVAVYLASFDEGIEIFKLAAAEPTLNSIHWFGGDGIVLSTAVTGNAAAADFAIKTGFFAPSFGLPTALESKWKPVADRIKTRTGVDPDAFALAVYDAMWAIAYTLKDTDGSTTDFAKLRTGFIAQANKDNGILGADALDAFGDRASGTFDYFGIVKTGTTYTWGLVGKSE